MTSFNCFLSSISPIFELSHHLIKNDWEFQMAKVSGNLPEAWLEINATTRQVPQVLNQDQSSSHLLGLMFELWSSCHQLITFSESGQKKNKMEKKKTFSNLFCIKWILFGLISSKSINFLGGFGQETYQHPNSIDAGEICDSKLNSKKKSAK